MYPDDAARSGELFRRAQVVLPGGNSRHTVYFAPFPLYAAYGKGCEVTDVDGVTRIDFLNNYSSLIHGHGHAAVLEAVSRQLARLTAVGLPTESEIRHAALLAERFPAAQRVRFTNSGTEAVMLAIKAARAYTGRTKIAKAEGAYHGSYDYAEVSQAPTPLRWGSPNAPSSVAQSPGSPQAVESDVVVLPFNDAAATAALLQRHEAELAAVLLDVLPAHLSYTQASADFLEVVRKFHGTSRALLILDEVYSLRLHLRGAHTKHELRPDLIAMGKIIGGGFPVGALGGSVDVMSVFEERGDHRVVPHGGTYNANPISMVAGTAALQAYDGEAVERLNALGERARAGLRDVIKIAGIEAQVIGDASLMAIRLNDRPARNYRDLLLSESEKSRMAAFHRHLLDSGILAAPQLLFILSTPMQAAEIDRLCEACLSAFRLVG